MAYGGFTPFKYNHGMAGLGDFWSDVGVDPAYTGTQLSTSPPKTSSAISTIAGIPSWALLIGGFLVAALILPAGRR